MLTIFTDVYKTTMKCSRPVGVFVVGGIESGNDGLGRRDDATTNDRMGWSNEGKKQKNIVTILHNF